MVDEPKVERGAAASWPAAAWTFEGLAERLGDARVPVHTGRWRWTGWRVARDGATRQLAAGPWLRELAAGRAEGYLAGFEPFRRVPALREDLAFPPVGAFHVDVAWIGPAGIETPIHLDSAPNVYAQLVGRKRWRIWRPEAPLKPRLAAPGYRMSALDLHAGVDEAGPPDLDLVLEPGDLLFLPPQWWHRVDTLEASIAVNRWWKLERLGKLLG